jgi:hypothetical protein
MEMKEGKKQRRLGERAWRDLIGRCEAAGAPVREFCQREGLSISSFQRWRSRLARQTPAVSARQPARGASAASARFVDLGAVGEYAGARGSPLEIRIELGGGLVVQLRR